jgi:hypothetical protein
MRAMPSVWGIRSKYFVRCMAFAGIILKLSGLLGLQHWFLRDATVYGDYLKALGWLNR